MTLLYLMCTALLLPSAYAAEAASPPAVAQHPAHTHYPSRFRKFARGNNFSEIVQAMAVGLRPKATRTERARATKAIEVLTKLFQGPAGAPKHRHAMKEAIRLRNDPNARDEHLADAEEYRRTHPPLHFEERARLTAGLRSTIAQQKAREPQNLEAKEAHRAVYRIIEQTIAPIIGDTNRSSFDDFAQTYGPSVALGLYHTGDAYLEMKTNNQQVDALSETDAHDVLEGSTAPGLPLQTGATLARHGVNSIYGLMPFVSWSDYNNAATHSFASKLIAASHLTARISNVLHKWLRGQDTQLSSTEAYKLARHNFVHGPHQAAKDLKKASRTFGRMRLAMRILGQGVTPGLFAHHYTSHPRSHSYTSPGLASANVSGFVDSIMDICWRIYVARKMRELKKCDSIPAPTPQQELHYATDLPSRAA